MSKLFGFSVSLTLLLMLSCAGGGTPQQTNSPPLSQDAQQQTQQNFTGDGGKGMSLTIYAPKAAGLAENQSYLPGVVQREFVDNFSGYSGISVLDYERLGEQYAVLLGGYFDDNVGTDLGHLPETTHMMSGNITRTATGYALQMSIIKNADKMTAASYSGNFTFAELDNRTGIRRASIDLLQKMGVTLTTKGREELAGAAMENRIIAQTSVARGVAAKTEVEALTFYFQAAAYDPSLMEAASRSSILNANITSGNIGDNIRNDIQWRRDWVARLTETEQFFDSFNRTESMPYTLFYTSDIKQVGQINYQNETVVMGGIETHLHGSGIWTASIERALQAVYDGLDATRMKNEWGLGNWPQQGVSNQNFAGRSQNFSVVFELLNDQEKVIGRQTLQTGGSWGLNYSGRPTVNVNADERKALNFQNVSANDISDRMTIRVATVNGTNAETAARNGVLQIRSSNKSDFDRNDRWRFAKGEIQGFANDAARDAVIRYSLYSNLPFYSEKVKLLIPNNIWGDPVTYIGRGAFKNYDTRLGIIVIPDSVTSISREAFRITSLHGSITITIGKNVALSQNSFVHRVESFDFNRDYTQNGMKAGIYKGFWVGPYWGYKRLECLNTTTGFVFPSAFIGTWKKGKHTLTFTSDTVMERYMFGGMEWKPTSDLLKISGDSYDLGFPEEMIVRTVTIKHVNGKLLISGFRNWLGTPPTWNGTWIKQ